MTDEITAAQARSPRAWGWTDVFDHARAVRLEIPTRVGMDRERRKTSA